MAQRIIYILLLILMFPLPANADKTVELKGKLLKPLPSKPWINKEHCKAPEDFHLRFHWDARDSQYKTWILDGDDCYADVFLSKNEKCGRPDVEIGAVVTDDNNKYDVVIEDDQLYGEFPPEDEDDLLLAEIEGLDCNSDTIQEDYYFCIKWTHKYDVGLTDKDTYTYYASAELRFDVKAPDKPQKLEVYPGETSLHVDWDAPCDDDVDKDGGYDVQFRVADSSDEWSKKEIKNATKTDCQIKGLENHTEYEVQVAAYDKAKNKGEYCDSVYGTPEPVEDFYEHYREQGGRGEGGACFVATAAYGSYDHKMVVPLRHFRDTVLSKSLLGRMFIRIYYRFGPRWARAIHASDLHRTMVRSLLVPIVRVVSLYNTNICKCIVFLVCVGIIVLLGYSVRASTFVLVLVVAAFFITIPSRAYAHTTDFQVQIRFGPYYPNVDDEQTLGDSTPFKTIFGSGSRLLFEAGFDWEVWHHNVGIVTLGGAAGFTRYKGKGVIRENGILKEAYDTTSLNLIPLRFNVGYHFDMLAKRWGVPLVPYAYGGVSYYVWWVLDGLGDVAKWEDDDGNKSTARGGIFGLHGALGLKLLLDIIDSGAADHLETESGVMNTYLFAEYIYSWVNGFNSQECMNLGDGTYMLGLMFEF